jgi:hypothetical protein
MEESKK